MFAWLKGAPWVVSRATVRRLRTREGLQGVKNTRQRRPLGQRPTVPRRALSPNPVWRDDVGPDETTDGRRRQCLTGRDESTREGLSVACARSITAGDGVHGLQGLFAPRGTPPSVKRDKGPECMAPQVTAWLHAHHGDTHVSEPGSPWQNGHHDSLTGVLRDGGLNRWLLASVQEARRLIKNWREE
jgi:putative transposase